MSTYQYNRFCPCVRCRMNSMLVPAILVTLGVLLLLDNVHAIYFHRSWPILLIVLGSIKVLQSSATTEGHRTPMTTVGVVSPPAPATEQGPTAGSSQSDEVR
jgi:hypothetical protein